MTNKKAASRFALVALAVVVIDKLGLVIPAFLLGPSRALLLGLLEQMHHM